VGTSRKSFLGRVAGGGPDDRLEPTLASVAWAIDRGASMVRVHDVAPTVQLVRLSRGASSEAAA
jgi:dihydropteroate synthase